MKTQILTLITLFILTIVSCKTNDVTAWYTGKPYKKIIIELSKPGNVISELKILDSIYVMPKLNFITSVSLDTLNEPMYDNGSKYYYLVRFEFIEPTWDSKTMYKIEQIITSCINVVPSGNGSLLWKTPLYDIELWHNARGHMNLIIFEK